jgi:hypothetical protein
VVAGRHLVPIARRFGVLDDQRFVDQTPRSMFYVRQYQAVINIAMTLLVTFLEPSPMFRPENRGGYSSAQTANVLHLATQTFFVDGQRPGF